MVARDSSSTSSARRSRRPGPVDPRKGRFGVVGAVDAEAVAAVGGAALSTEVGSETAAAGRAEWRARGSTVLAGFEAMNAAAPTMHRLTVRPTAL
jgi:hypothetical protein